MRRATVCFLLSEESVLLGKRLSLFCNGIWNGPGGKQKSNESLKECAIRETAEEVGVYPYSDALCRFAVLNAYHPAPDGYRREWRVHFYVATNWHGTPWPREGFEYLQWFPLRDLPYDRMMPDQMYWLPQAIAAYQKAFTCVDIYYADAQLNTVKKGFFRNEKPRHP